ncbi:MAG: c-type cytochrome biogenesis protein CcsB [Proteobacteria bacterium]|nr:c-type cytochrome biogenesis protein CcsB [Pseudomonadota bacterium]
MNIYLSYIALSFYVISTISCLFYLTVSKKIIERLGHYFFIIGLSIHFFATLVRYLKAGYTPITNAYEALSFFSLCIACFFLYIKKMYKMEMLGSIFLPVLTIIFIFAFAFPTEIKPLPPALNSYWLPVHTIFSFIGSAVFLISFFVSVVYLIVEKNIKKKRFSPMTTRFPSLETLDLINYRCISYGFTFLTIGIITGSIWASTIWGSYWNWDPKETWSLITWIVYAILIHNRLTIGWRGRKTAYMMIIGFFSILITFFGVSFFLGGQHSFI